MDLRAEKIAKARQKLKDHQEKKISAVQKDECLNKLTLQNEDSQNINYSLISDDVTDNYKRNIEIGNPKELLLERMNGDNSNIDKKSDMNVTEILISTKTNLEMQIITLTEKLTHLESLYGLESSNHNNTKQKIAALELELNELSEKYAITMQENSLKDVNIADLNNMISIIRDENNNISEQLEFTKSMLTTKESEIAQLHNNICSYQNQLDVFQLQIQQLTSNPAVQPERNNKNGEEIEVFVKKISSLEQTIVTLQKERDQINSHYEHYVRELNDQLRSELIKNENQSKEIQNLYNRENSLIEQISDMEIRLQNYNMAKEDNISKKENDIEIQKKHQDTLAQLMETNIKYTELQKQYMDSLAKLQELSKAKETDSNQENFSVNQLNADITSDKIAAQRATEQNKKLKSDIVDLEQVIIKMGKDKLELTEMWTHEKQLNKGLALKLADVEENVKSMLKRLKAKDEEMIRLQNENRELEKKNVILTQVNQTVEHDNTEKNCNHDIIETACNNHNTNHEEIPLVSSLVDVESSVTKLDINSDKMIPKEDAMSKLQARFLNIMDQVANLSDEKHRLEHIILQLQNETETICEYVALYQQQRSLLKKREEERSNQLKIYQSECDKLKQHLEELRDLLLSFAADRELESYLKEERRHNDLIRVKELLELLQNCSLINPKFKNLDLNVFYPCSCCSGQIIHI